MAKEAPQIALDTQVVLNPNMVLREEGDEGAILFDPDSGAVRVLNLTATTIWKLLEQERTLRQIMAALREQFEGMDEQAEEQVLGLVRELVRLGALGTVEKPAA